MFAQDPAHGVEDVGFAATVRADDGRDAFVEIEHGLIGERFEPEEFKGVEVHRMEVTEGIRPVFQL